MRWALDGSVGLSRRMRVYFLEMSWLASLMIVVDFDDFISFSAKEFIQILFLVPVIWYLGCLVLL